MRLMGPVIGWMSASVSCHIWAILMLRCMCSFKVRCFLVFIMLKAEWDINYWSLENIHSETTEAIFFIPLFISIQLRFSYTLSSITNAQLKPCIARGILLLVFFPCPIHRHAYYTNYRYYGCNLSLPLQSTEHGFTSGMADYVRRRPLVFFPLSYSSKVNSIWKLFQGKLVFCF